MGPVKSAVARAVCLGICVCLAAAYSEDRPKLSCAEMEQFLLTAKVGPGRETAKGVTRPKRAVLDDGRLKHEAVIQTIDERKTQFVSDRGSEMNFRDYWGFNIAGYELAKLLDLNMVPPYVARSVGGSSSSLSWLVDNVMMDEVDRKKKKVEPPDMDSWNKQMYALRVFNELIYNTDANLTNVLITKDWQIWMIDFTRAFRLHKTLRAPENLVQCDRRLLARLRALDRKELEEKLVKPKYLSRSELDGLLARRDRIVQFFDNAVKQKGEGAVLFDLPRSGQPCGVGL